MTTNGIGLDDVTDNRQPVIKIGNVSLQVMDDNLVCLMRGDDKMAVVQSVVERALNEFIDEWF